MSTIADVDRLDRHQSRDLLLLAACYDQSMAETYKGRWHPTTPTSAFLDVESALAADGRLLGDSCPGHRDDPAGGFTPRGMWITAHPYLWLISLVGVWVPWGWKLVRRLAMADEHPPPDACGNQSLGPLRQVLMQFTGNELASQPLPNKDSTDSRYELLVKFQTLLDSLGFAGIVVLVDRVDEPHLINGSAELHEGPACGRCWTTSSSSIRAWA